MHSQAEVKQLLKILKISSLPYMLIIFWVNLDVEYMRGFNMMVNSI